MSQFAILRIEKVKTFGELRARSKHNARATGQGVEHCNKDRPPIDLMKGKRPDALTAWDERAARAGVDRSSVRKNGVLAVEWLATASPEWFKDKTPEQVKAWVQDSFNHIAARAGGPQNILSAHLHLDETTPHIQVLSIPIVVKKTKDGPQRRLSSRDLIGGHRDRLVELQDEYHAAVAHHDLERGRPRKETGAKNKPPSVWRREQREAAEVAKEAARQAIARAAALERLMLAEGRPVPKEAATVLDERRKGQRDTSRIRS